MVHLLIKDYIKQGFGLTIGLYLAKAAVEIGCGVAVGLMANDKKTMEWMKNHTPKSYENFKKYQSE